MSQHDFNITQADADAGVDYRAAVNAALQALGSLSSGATAPTTTYAYQIWIDTTKINTPSAAAFIRNSSNTAWVEFYKYMMQSVLSNGSGNGAYSIAVGYGGLAFNTTGQCNTSVGYNALAFNTTGLYNVAIGFESMKSAYSTSTGSYNTAIGSQSLLSLTSGGSNTCIGLSSGASLTTGNFNTFIGNTAGSHVSQKINANNTIAIGNGSYTTKDNQVVIGNSSITETLISGVLTKRSLDTAPASATATGTTGEIRITTTHIYVCTATNTWVRSALSTW